MSEKEDKNLFITPQELSLLEKHLEVLTDLEKLIDRIINKYYYGSVAWLDPLVWSFLFIATVLNLVGLYFYKHNYFYLSVIFIPVGCFFLVLKYIRYLRKKNTLKILSQTGIFPDRIRRAIRYHVHKNMKKYEELIKFEFEQEMISKKTRFKILKIFEQASWKNNKLARQNCLYLGYLMINLQIKIINGKKHVKRNS